MTEHFTPPAALVAEMALARFLLANVEPRISAAARPCAAPPGSSKP